MTRAGHSLAYVLFAGDDNIDWAGAPRAFNLTLASLVVLALVLWRHTRLRDWMTAVRRKGPEALLLRALAALLLLIALSLAVLAA